MSVVVGKSMPVCSGVQPVSNAARAGRQARLVNRHVVKATSVPSVATEVATVPLTKTDLVKYMASGCRPRKSGVLDHQAIYCGVSECASALSVPATAIQSKFGTEHEKLGYRLSDRRRPSYDEIQQLLTALCGRFGWDPMLEEGMIIGATFEGQSVTLEPGGQLELSGAPVDTLHKTCAEVNSHLYQVKTIAEEMGLAFLGLGFDPKWAVPEVPIMPKDRYRIMREYMPKVGSMGHDMMFRSCTVQVNIDFESEADMVEKMRVSLALQPVCTALFANSPFRDGRPTGYKSWRSHVWTDVDNNRCGILPFVFDPGFGFEHYVEYALRVPMYFVYRKGRYIDVTGQSFRDFIRGELPGLPGEMATMKDWENHLTTIFPEVRLKKFMEMRGADSAPWRMICALSALWVGLLYDRDAQATAADLIADWTPEERVALREEVPRLALQTPFRGGTVNDLAKKMLALAREGLQRRGMGEESFLAPLEEISETGVTLADELLDKYYGEWDEDVDRVYSPEFSY